MNPKSLFNKALTYPVHENTDLHYIGEALPAPSNPAAVLSLGTVASPGGSAVPAREDHVHSLDLAELVDAINADPGIVFPPTSVDLSNYYTIAEIDALFLAFTPDLTNYYTKAQVDALDDILATSISDLSDSVFAALALYYTKDEIDAQTREIIWTYNSIVKPTADWSGPRWPAPYDLQINSLIVTLQTSSAVNYTIKLYIANVLEQTCVVTAGQLSVTFTFTEVVSAGTNIYIAIDAASTGTGTNLAAIVRFERL